MDNKIKVSRTVGWFTSLYPVCLNVEDEPRDFNIKYLKEQIRKVPNKGFHYGVLKYLKNELNEQKHRYVRFNYLVGYESSMKNKSLQPFRAGYEFYSDKGNMLTAVLDSNAMKIDGKSMIVVVFSRNKFSEKSMRNFLSLRMIELSVLHSLC